MIKPITIYIELTSQSTTAILDTEYIGIYDYCAVVLKNVQNLKPFPMFSKVRFLGKEEWFYCNYEKKMLISKDTRSFAEWFSKSNKESKEKSMLHNVTVKHEENKVLEKYWLMRAIKDGDMYGQPPTPKRVISEKECTREPTPNEVAQFLSDSKADFVSVVQNYRFENELPFC